MNFLRGPSHIEPRVDKHRGLSTSHYRQALTGRQGKYLPIGKRIPLETLAMVTKISLASPASPRRRMTTIAHEPVADRLLDTARALFLEHGYAGTSLQMIADELGVTKAALYYHVKTKDDLLAALVTPVLAELERLLDEIEAAPARRRPRLFVDRYVDFLLQHRGVSALGVRDATFVTHPLVVDVVVRIQRRIKRLLHADELSFEEGVRFAGALGALQAGVAAFPDAESAQLRPPMLSMAQALLPRKRRSGCPDPLTIDEASG
jgi:AcrR family transcriptional regulator